LAWVRIYLLKPSKRKLADLTEPEILSEREREERKVAGFNISFKHRCISRHYGITRVPENSQQKPSPMGNPLE
jgi:hypothetical protein